MGAIQNQMEQIIIESDSLVTTKTINGEVNRPVLFKRL